MTTTTADAMARRTGWPSEQAIQTCLRQIGRTIHLAVSGGRTIHDSSGWLLLPVQYGHVVAVRLDQGADLYDVEHQFRRGGRTWTKARWERVHAEDLSQTVYHAACWRDR